MSESVEIPTQYTHSLKFEETAKGVRISTHVYGNDRQTVVTEAYKTYFAAQELLKSKNVPLAPMEIEPKK